MDTRRFTHKLLAFITAMTMMLSCSQQYRPDEAEFSVLYTTQMYGNLLAWSMQHDTINPVSLANFSSLVKEQRELYGDHCIVLDNGNLLTRRPINFVSLCIDTVSEPIAYQVQRFIGYDAVAVGNSDLRVAELFYARHHDTISTPPVICANLYNDVTGQHFFRPWICIERQGIRFAIFSLVDEEGDSWIARIAHPDASCKEMSASIISQYMEMRRQCNPDVIIGMVNSPRQLHLMQQLPHLDYVIEQEYGPGIDNRSHAGMIRFTLTKDDETNTYTKQIRTTVIDLSQYEIDPAFDEHFAPAVSEMRKFYYEQFGYLHDTIRASEGLYTPYDNYRDILNQAQLWYSGADVSLTNIANYDCQLMPGPMDLRKIIDIFNHENVMVQFIVRGYELKRLLESYSALQFATMKSADDPLLALRLDKKGHQMWNVSGQPYLKGIPALYTTTTGVHYTMDLRRQPGDRISIGRFSNGRSFHPDSLYTVVTSSFLASRLHELEFLDWSPTDIRRHRVEDDCPNIQYVLYKYFKEYPGAYTPDTTRYVSIEPVSWWRNAMQREQQSLHPTW